MPAASVAHAQHQLSSITSRVGGGSLLSPGGFGHFPESARRLRHSVFREPHPARVASIDDAGAREVESEPSLTADSGPRSDLPAIERQPKSLAANLAATWVKDSGASDESSTMERMGAELYDLAVDLP